MNNLSTLNEENSFFIVDLTPDRSIIPTSYTLRNRNSSMYVMLNWVIEASNDGLHFVELDRRINLEGGDAANLQLTASLKVKGAAHTYAITNNFN